MEMSNKETPLLIEGVRFLEFIVVNQHQQRYSDYSLWKGEQCKFIGKSVICSRIISISRSSFTLTHSDRGGKGEIVFHEKELLE